MRIFSESDTFSQASEEVTRTGKFLLQYYLRLSRGNEIEQYRKAPDTSMPRGTLTTGSPLADLKS